MSPHPAPLPIFPPSRYRSSRSSKGSNGQLRRKTYSISNNIFFSLVEGGRSRFLLLVGLFCNGLVGLSLASLRIWRKLATVIRFDAKASVTVSVPTPAPTFVISCHTLYCCRLVCPSLGPLWWDVEKRPFLKVAHDVGPLTLFA